MGLYLRGGLSNKENFASAAERFLGGGFISEFFSIFLSIKLQLRISLAN